MEQADSIAAAVPAAALTGASGVLVTGPSRDAVRGVPTGLLSAVASGGDGVVAVSTSESTRTVLNRVEHEVDGIDRHRIGVVDCTPKAASVRSNPRALRWRVPSPMDLTGSCMAVNECLSTLFERDVATRHLLFDSLSRQLLGGETDVVARYAHQLLVSTDEPGALGVFPVYGTRTSDRELSALTHLFDGVVEVRRHDGGRQLRSRGLPDASTEWVDVPPAAPGRIGDVDVH